MTVGEMKELLDGLPDEMLAIIPVEDNIFLAVCRGRSGVMVVTYPDTEPEEMLVLFPCNCNSEDLPIDLETNPN